MTSTLARILGVAAVLALTFFWAIAAASSASSLSTVPGGRTASPAALAVTASTTQAADVAAAAIPADFEPVMGYRPQVRHGLLVDPEGTCSSPVPLPEDFTPACAEHDLGYDLLRFADLTGHRLGAWARTAIDDRLALRLRAVCAGLDPGPRRALCSTAAHVATMTVRVNSVRQLEGVPEETPGSWAVSGLAVAVLAVASARLVGSRRVPGPSKPAREVPV